MVIFLALAIFVIPLSVLAADEGINKTNTETTLKTIAGGVSKTPITVMEGTLTHGFNIADWSTGNEGGVVFLLSITPNNNTGHTCWVEV